MPDDKPNGRGRPRIDAEDRTMTVSFTLTPRQYAILCKHARRRHVSASALLRKMIERFPGFSEFPII